MTHRGKTHEIPITGSRRHGPQGEPARGASGEREPRDPEEPVAPADHHVAGDPSGEAGGTPRSGESAAHRREPTLEDLQRLQAEFSNYRKRVERERLETVTWAQRTLVEKLIPVLEDLDRALTTLGGDTSPAAQGLSLLSDKLHAVLAEAGLERMESVGESFDPARHEALMTQPVEPERVGKVLAELVPGFTFRGKLVRPARVQVGVEGEEAGFED
jgi:molecular chaperone GrpE